MKIAVIAGIRPQFVKLASLQNAITKWQSWGRRPVEALYINSGQHYDSELSSLLIDQLNVQIDIDLTKKHTNVSTPIDVFGSMVIHLYDVLRALKDIDWVIVFGDANTTLAGAIASIKAQLPLVHIEAGLRPGNVFNSEMHNSLLTDHISSIRFLTTKQDLANLQREGLHRHTFWVGDLVLDLMLEIKNKLPQNFGFFKPGEYVLSTMHHPENIESDENLQSIMLALNHSNRPVLFVTHPRTLTRLKGLGLLDLDNIIFQKSLSYIDMLAAIKNCAFVVTDSGGIQRESFYLGKRCVLRQAVAFWPILVRPDAHLMVGSSKEEIEVGFHHVENMLGTPLPKLDDFGSGIAGISIIKHLLDLSGSQSFI